jgi:hypothetical protein
MPDTTTIQDALQAFVTQLRSNVVADPPTPTRPFRRVELGLAGTNEFPRPFLALRLTRTRPVGTIEGDKLFEVSMELRLVTDVSLADPHAEVLDRIAALEDYLDSVIDTGFQPGAEGFDDRVWTFEFPRTSAGARVAAAVATQTFVARVARQQN